MTRNVFALLGLVFFLSSCSTIQNARLIRSYEIILADASPTDTTIAIED